ncbi:TetR/AcrR family transcriptional regulator [Kibdelosporangium phytohabitans]|uniref:Transcriptional regulator n=1 Tax=Kibdelosporangium phytohabitans TaxID=860235 RepID=A0A0N9HSZ6_9PSEU|nr:TetR/AcrR family transcriptional regulator [Kibdelosporangium phytohabitans]ALG10348.1 transcriptional regulator [Kibdelosporangium phytohabitans]MBE1461393.1 TetR/AcrR family tetracycline transcriptional repressor [Kibdelosporangium phytohabitans]
MATSSTPQRAGPGRGRPPRLDAARTVDVALALLDEAGLDALTMRRLADAVGAQVGALYRYFATKQDLLTAMAERMLAGCGDPLPSHENWPGQVAEMAERMRNALLRYQDGARVFAGTHAVGVNTLSFSDTLVGVLRGAGFADEDAARATFAIVSFVIGHTLEEQAADAYPQDGPLLESALEPGAFPHLTAARHTLTSADFGTHFRFGLKLIITGLRHHEPGRQDLHNATRLSRREQR